MVETKNEFDFEIGPDEEEIRRTEEIDEEELLEEFEEDSNNATVDGIKSYLKSIGKYRILSKAEVSELLNKGDQKSKEKVINHNLKLAFYIAKRYQNRGLPLLDVIQEANLGLVKAVDRFEPEKGYAFGTYAVWWITASIRRSIQEVGTGMRIPVYVTEMIGKVKNAQHQFEINNIEYTEEDIAKKTGLTLANVKKALLAQKNSEVLSLDYESDDEKDSILQTIEDEDTNIEVEYINDERKQLIIKHIQSTCSPKESEVILRHLGFYGSPETFGELRESFGVTKQRIQQLYKRGIEKLKKRTFKF